MIGLKITLHLGVYIMKCQVQVQPGTLNTSSLFSLVSSHFRKDRLFEVTHTRMLLNQLNLISSHPWCGVSISLGRFSSSGLSLRLNVHTMSFLKLERWQGPPNMKQNSTKLFCHLRSICLFSLEKQR